MNYMNFKSGGYFSILPLSLTLCTRSKKFEQFNAQSKKYCFDFKKKKIEFLIMDLI